MKLPTTFEEVAQNWDTPREWLKLYLVSITLSKELGLNSPHNGTHPCLASAANAIKHFCLCLAIFILSHPSPSLFSNKSIGLY